MKNKGLKILFYAAALAFFAGAYFLCSAFVYRLPRGVSVNGEEVGGLTYSAAEKTLRSAVEEKLKSKKLIVCAGENVYEYAFPEIYYVDDFSYALKRITKKGAYELPVHYYLNGAESIADYVCSDAERAVCEPYCVFNSEGQPFDYYEGCDGVYADRQKLLDDISASVNGGWEKVILSTCAVPRKTTLESVKKNTVKLCSFTTYFDGANAERSSNIRLAASKLNGSILGAGECFSFNGTVGARTEQNGFKQAKIIENGKFVLGYGGGVCQVSTTLYNAAVLSGLEIAEYHPHSLAVSYVAPSRDAMVSGSYCDLKFINNRLTPVYIRAKCTVSSITCTVFGPCDGYEYSFKSELAGTVPRPDDEEVEGDEEKIISYGKDGVISYGYLVKEGGGTREEKLIRKDKYLPVAGVRQVKRKSEEQP